MEKKEKIGLLLMGLGILIGIIMVYDVLSIIGDLVSLITGFDLNVKFLNSFGFRLIGILLGGIFLLIGGFIYKKNSKD